MDLLWNEADIDMDGSLSFSEAVCLLNPAYTSVALQGAVEVMLRPLTCIYVTHM